MQHTIYCVGPDPGPGIDSLQQALAQRGIPARVEAVPVNTASVNRELALLLRDEALLGALILGPVKQTALAYCQELTHAAQMLGGVTVLIRRSSGLVSGDNTELAAFTGTLGEAGVKRVRTALVLGAGQAARIALAGLRELNCARYLVGYRSPRRPAELGSQLRGMKKQLLYFPMHEMDEFFAWTRHANLFDDKLPLAAPGKTEDGIKRWDLLVNATPVGMDDAAPPVIDALNYLRCFMRVLDMAPRTEGTRLTRAAIEAGVPALTGARIVDLTRQFALEAWERELRRRTLAAEGKLDVIEDPVRPSRYGPQPPRVPILKRRSR